LPLPVAGTVALRGAGSVAKTTSCSGELSAVQSLVNWYFDPMKMVGNRLIRAAGSLSLLVSLAGTSPAGSTERADRLNLDLFFLLTETRAGGTSADCDRFCAALAVGDFGHDGFEPGGTSAWSGTVP